VNDPQHFPAWNGRGHRRRKVVNMPALTRYQLDPYEERALELIGEVDRWLIAEQDRQERARVAREAGWIQGWPGE
jgi:hypothetical protein